MLLVMFYLDYTTLHAHTHTHTKAYSLALNRSSLCPFAIFQHLFLNFSLIFPQFHSPRGGQQELREKEKREGKETERGREKWWKPRSKTGKLIFFFGTLLLSASGIEYKLINLPGCTCHDTRGLGKRYGAEERGGASQEKQCQSLISGVGSIFATCAFIQR